MTRYLQPALTSTRVFSTPVHLCTSYPDWLYGRLQQKQGAHVVTLNSEMVMLAQQDAEVAAVFEQAELVIPDGAGVTIYLRLEKIKQDRCPGIELAAGLMRRLAQLPDPPLICFYGGEPGVTEQAATRWQEEFPQLQFLTNHGFLDEAAQAQWLETLSTKKPALILVGLGVPRQEYWIRDHRQLCENSIWIGVGGSFDVWSGNKQRAPDFFCRHNLEWLYRLYQEPWRWRRMLVLPQFLWRAIFCRPR